ncbi:MAG: hypothetical protein ACQEXJ_04620 [Myxococcota bacterium]
MSGLRTAAILAVGLVACAPAYRDRVAPLHAALASGDAEAALARVDPALEAPGVRPGEVALLRLERAVLRMRLGAWDRAARDLAAADPAMEALDLGGDDPATLGRALFDGSARVYRAPPHERLLLQILGVAARLEAGDAAGARVEARRLEVLDRWYRDAGGAPDDLLRTARVVAGVAFEASGRPSVAARWYADAGFTAPARPGVVVVALSGRTPGRIVRYRGREAAMDDLRAARFDETVLQGREAALPVVGLAGGAPGVPAEATVDDAPATRLVDADVAGVARRIYERARPAMLVAAAMRRDLRHAAGAAATAGAANATATTGGLATVLGRVVTWGLSSADVPDTRSWSLAPARVQVLRRPASPGTHRVAIRLGDRFLDREVRVPPDGPAVVIALD